MRELGLGVGGMWAGTALWWLQLELLGAGAGTLEGEISGEPTVSHSSLSSPSTFFFSLPKFCRGLRAAFSWERIIQFSEHLDSRN